MGIQRVSRREFFKSTGRVASGLVLASHPLQSLTEGKLPVPIPNGVPDTALSLNLFIQISTDNQVYLVVHRSEMGQGIRTGLAQVLADEMEADWRYVNVVQAPGDSEYGNQNTDGSQSIRNFYEQMRQLGAAARWMLQHAAAQLWNVQPDECVVKQHRVERKDQSASLSFGELAVGASSQPAPDPAQLVLKNADTFRYIGHEVPAVDLHAFTDGSAQYAADVRLPGMLYASIERCPYLGGSIEQFEAKPALAVNGVVAVQPIPAVDGPPAFHPIPGVAVIAKNSWAAMEARKKLSIRWSDSEHQVHDSRDYQNAIRERLNKSQPKIARAKGQFAESYRNAAHHLEFQYTVPYLTHSPMEPMSVLAVATPEYIEVWASTQTPQAAQKQLSQRLGVSLDSVRVNVMLLGGGFGRKSKPDFVVEAALLSREMAGKPVLLTWTREDEIRHSYYHAISAIRIRAGLNRENRMVCFQAIAGYPSISSLWNPSAEFASSGELEQGLIDIPFDIEHDEIGAVEARAHTRIGWLRSVCNIQQAFAVGSFVDELARVQNKDTLDTWLEVIGRDRFLDYEGQKFKPRNYGRSLQEFPFDTARLKNVLKLVADRSNYRATLPDQEGWGLSCHYSFLTFVAVATRVRLLETKVSVLEVHVAVDCGLAVNPDRVKAQMEGAVVFGLSLALMGEVTFESGAVLQSNFDSYPLLRMGQCPDIHVHLVERKDPPRGVGEPGVPPVAPSLTNAIVSAGGERIRDLPVNRVFKV